VSNAVTWNSLKVIRSEEMALQYLRENNLLEDPEQAVINCGVEVLCRIKED
jgi:hypothetical protein